jgi:hypothetical protein
VPPQVCFHGSFGKDHACDQDLPGTLLPITQSSSDRNERATFLPLINTDLHDLPLSVASVAELVTHIVRSLNEIVSLNLRKHRTFPTITNGIAVAKVTNVDLSPLDSTERKKRK